MKGIIKNIKTNTTIGCYNLIHYGADELLEMFGSGIDAESLYVVYLVDWEVETMLPIRELEDLRHWCLLYDEYDEVAKKAVRNRQLDVAELPKYRFRWIYGVSSYDEFVRNQSLVKRLKIKRENYVECNSELYEIVKE